MSIKTISLPNVVRMESQLTCDNEFYELEEALKDFKKENGMKPIKITVSWDTHRKISRSVQAPTVFSEDFTKLLGIPYECTPQQSERWIFI